MANQDIMIHYKFISNYLNINKIFLIYVNNKQKNQFIHGEKNTFLNKCGTWPRIPAHNITASLT